MQGLDGGGAGMSRSRRKVSPPAALSELFSLFKAVLRNIVRGGTLPRGHLLLQLHRSPSSKGPLSPQGTLLG